ncbi:bacillithiol biosynthesis cysteine-adding enzyme BshC [Salipaludibacillus sp. HK11]|uniref:bacillithiol biosynthesis cysteine-adding enzyme BshC n=1 Tax=Salipaludibacillus sp. HK11 TaxID=3394320 RepID=UPI0039FD3DA8
MQVKVENTVETGSFIDKYIHQDSHIHSFFDYNLSGIDSKSRYNELMSQTYEREKLVIALRKYNQTYHPSERAMKQIERLKDLESVVVVGGQQAGLLTGPLYTVNKIISILLEAKNLEEQLSVPVIPIFWIAGEDHDIDEVNHTYFYDGENSKKIRIPEKNDIKSSMSERFINAEAKREIEEAFRFLHETSHTRKLYDDLINDLSEEMTYTEWCGKILHRLFCNTDLVLMDAADPNIRQIERNYFKQMVEKNDTLRTSFIDQGNLIKDGGLGEPIALDKNNAHLFFHEGNQRFLLEKTEIGFREKQGERNWTEAELLNQLENGTLRLSNNVVTRPIMQDFLLPVHTFIAGPGELKYWAALKKAFHTFGKFMPVIRPRLHLTYVSRKTEQNLFRYHLKPEAITLSGVKEVQERLIEEGKELDEKKILQEAESDLKNVVEKFTEKLTPLGKGIIPINDKYKSQFDDRFKLYQKSVQNFLLLKNETHLRRLDKIEIEIKPHGHWQERYLNIYPFLNQYGDDLVERTLKALTEAPIKSVAGSHVYIFL